MVKEKKEIRDFGLLVGIAFIIIGALFLWRGKGFWTYLMGVGVLLVLLGLIFPLVLKPVYKGWMAMARFLGGIMTYVILFLLFYIVVTPIALLYRLFNPDPLKLKFDPSVSSYWVKREVRTKEVSSYRHQF